MERRQWIVLGVVLLLVLLYLASLGAGLFRDDGRRSLSDATEGVASALEGMLGTFAPRLDGSRLYCNQQRIDRAFSLDGDGANCDIDIAARTSEKYRKGTLAVEQGNPALTIYVRSSKSDTAQTAGVTMDCKAEGVTRARTRLEIIYQPDGEKDAGESCWIEQKLTAKEHRAGKTMPEVGIVVLTDPDNPKNGATLTLKHVCQGCSVAQAKLQLILR